MRHQAKRWSISVYVLVLLALGLFASAGVFQWNDVSVFTTGSNKETAATSRPDDKIATPAVPLADIPADSVATQQNSLGLVMALVGMIDLPEELRQYNQTIQQYLSFADPSDVFGKNWAQRAPLLFPYPSSTQYHPSNAEAFYELAISMTIASEKTEDALRRYNQSLSRMSTLAIPGEKLYQALMRGEKTGPLGTTKLQFFPDTSEACRNQANALVGVGRLREAVALYVEALRLNPNDAEAHNNFGNVLSMLGQAHMAVEQYLEALQLKPNYPGAHSNFGNALVADGRPAEAIEHYEKALIVWPDSPYIHNNLGEAFSLLGKYLEAIPHFREALRLKPDFSEARTNLDKAHEALKK